MLQQLLYACTLAAAQRRPELHYVTLDGCTVGLQLKRSLVVSQRCLQTPQLSQRLATPQEQLGTLQGCRTCLTCKLPLLFLIRIHSVLLLLACKSVPTALSASAAASCAAAAAQLQLRQRLRAVGHTASPGTQLELASRPVGQAGLCSGHICLSFKRQGEAPERSLVVALLKQGCSLLLELCWACVMVWAAGVAVVTGAAVPNTRDTR